EKDKDEKLKDRPQTPSSPQPEDSPDPMDEKIALLDRELNEVKDKYLRALAEMDNFKKRNSEELVREKKYAAMPVCDKLIDAIDVFDQALSIKVEQPEMQNFLYGFKMIKDLLFNVLLEEGVKPIDVQIGDVFDPTVAHAIETTSDPDKNDNVVVKIVKKGYKFKDRILRATMVITNVKPVETASENPKTDNTVA
ncbi:MAG TPA: nucleotide exchange factor GrpE, partial [Bacillota bacterium]|nr:nucleotide exchange factor GrpE [Bacillota bacterium]